MKCDWPRMDGEEMMTIRDATPPESCVILGSHDFVVKAYELPPIPENHVAARGGTVLVCKRCWKVEPR